MKTESTGISGGLNLYAFCGNNSINFRDPLGLEDIDVTVYDGNDIPESADCSGGRQFEGAAKRASKFNYDMGNDKGLSGLFFYLIELRSKGFSIKSISIYDHGINGRTQQYDDKPLIDTPDAELYMWAIGDLMKSDGVINMMGCWVGKEVELLQFYANCFNRKVTGSKYKVTYVTTDESVYCLRFNVRERSPKR